MKYLDGLTNLRDLQLNGTNISEIGLRQIAQRHRLKQLTLNDTSIDDRAVDALVAMKSLRQLHVHHTSLSSQGLRRLRSELPNCEISHGEVLESSTWIPVVPRGHPVPPLIPRVIR